MGQIGKIAEEKRETNKNEGEILEPSLTLYGTTAARRACLCGLGCY